MDCNGIGGNNMIYLCQCNAQFVNPCDLGEHINSCPEFQNGQLKESEGDQYELAVTTVQTEEEKTFLLWNENSTRILLKLYEENIDNFNSPRLRKKAVWEIISKQLKDQGYDVTSFQCENKWKSLFRSYKKVKDKNLRKSSFLFYEEIQRLLDKQSVLDSNEVPEKVLSVKKSPLKSSLHSKWSPSFQKPIIDAWQFRRQRLLYGRDELIELMKKKEENRERRHKRKIELLQQNNKLLEKLLDTISKNY